jgi:hypothetical protein
MTINLPRVHYSPLADRRLSISDTATVFVPPPPPHREEKKLSAKKENLTLFRLNFQTTTVPLTVDNSFVIVKYDCYEHSDWSKYMTLTNENTCNAIVILSKKKRKSNTVSVEFSDNYILV